VTPDARRTDQGPPLALRCCTVGTTPLWVPLVVAVLGLLGTGGGALAGALITQRRSDRREAATWTRERERERDLWAREDVLRNFEQRRVAYVDFYETLREMARTAYDHGMGLSEPEELAFEWNSATYRKLEHQRIYASPEVLAAADDAYNACWRWGDQTTHGRDDEPFYDRQDEYNDAELVLYDAIRRDLGISSVLHDGLPIPGSGWAVAEIPDDAGACDRVVPPDSA
jgi:hypothetical protein